MLIGIEASRANKTAKTGVEWYAWHVIQELKRQTGADGHSWVLYTNEALHSGLEVLPENWFEVRAKWPFRFGWTQLRLSWELKRRPIDVLWLPGSTMPRYLPKKSVVTLHDIGFHRLPHLYKKRQVHIHEVATREAARRATRIVTVSEFSGRELVEAYGIDPAKIAITPLGIDHTMYHRITNVVPIETRLARYRISRPFFITIGRLEAKKNIVGLIRAFTEFKTRRGIGDPHKLVLVGAPGYQYEEIKRAIAASGVRSDILELGYVPEVDIPPLLNAASALIHPSWYEGFGLPPVQAMACGCPVLSSTAASLPEVIGHDNALFFPPDQNESLIAAMERIVSEPGLATTLRDAGIARAAAYTWENTAKATLPVLTAW
ncbi:MAG: glycosyltransferase family 1 protein [Patescibacteria group bacterium]|jgi:glycosyltransferase involved in cell wall biosynthesis